MRLDAAPPRSTRLGSPLVRSRVYRVRPELVAEVKFLAWTEDNLLRQVVYEGLRGQAGAGGTARDPASETRRRRQKRPATKTAQPLIYGLARLACSGSQVRSQLPISVVRRTGSTISLAIP